MSNNIKMRGDEYDGDLYSYLYKEAIKWLVIRQLELNTKKPAFSSLQTSTQTIL